MEFLFHLLHTCAFLAVCVVCVCECELCLCCAVCVVAKLMPKMIFNCVQHTLGTGQGRAGCNIILLICVADCELPLIKVSCALLPRAACHMPHATGGGQLV